MRLQRLSELYYDIHRSYLKVTEVVNSEKRLFGRYYRVAFYGQVSLSPGKLYLGSTCHIAMPTVQKRTHWKTLNQSGHGKIQRRGQIHFKFLCLLFSCL